MQGLQTLIDQLTKERKLHISVLDLSGVLNTPATRIEFKNVIHSKKFCDIAKSTDKGFGVCLRCKMLANTKAIVDKKPFSGYCLYGIYEAAFPVIVNDTVAAIVYVGNAVIDQEKTQARINKVCRHTGVDSVKLCEEINRCEILDRPNELLQIAELIADYLKLLHDSSPKEKNNLHWLVSLMKQHADETYCSDISLKELAATYQKNEKYMGRLFKKEIGVSFNEYCMALRLRKAEKRIAKSNEKIIDIALDCGFNNISYFNRVFQKKHGMSPRAYRAAKSRHN